MKWTTVRPLAERVNSFVEICVVRVMTVWIGKGGGQKQIGFLYIGLVVAVLLLICDVELFGLLFVFSLFLMIKKWFWLDILTAEVFYRKHWQRQLGQQLQNTSENWDKGRIINCSFISIIVRHAIIVSATHLAKEFV